LISVAPVNWRNRSEMVQFHLYNSAFRKLFACKNNWIRKI